MFCLIFQLLTTTWIKSAYAESVTSQMAANVAAHLQGAVPDRQIVPLPQIVLLPRTTATTNQFERARTRFTRAFTHDDRNTSFNERALKRLERDQRESLIKGLLNEAKPVTFRELRCIERHKKTTGYYSKNPQSIGYLLDQQDTTEHFEYTGLAVYSKEANTPRLLLRLPDVKMNGNGAVQDSNLFDYVLQIDKAHDRLDSIAFRKASETRNSQTLWMSALMGASGRLPQDFAFSVTIDSRVHLPEQNDSRPMEYHHREIYCF